MSVTYKAIYSQTVSGTTTGSVSFNNIPQGYTDLMVSVSARCDAASIVTGYFILPNTDTNNLGSYTSLLNTGTTTLASRASGASFMQMAVLPGANATANVFGQSVWYIHNYSSTTSFKTIFCTSTSENNAATNFGEYLSGGLWRSNNAITNLYFPVSANYTAGTTFTVYGILRPQY